jgi:hypothetical protein
VAFRRIGLRAFSDRHCVLPLSRCLLLGFCWSRRWRLGQRLDSRPSLSVTREERYRLKDPIKQPEKYPVPASIPPKIANM